MTAVTDPPVTVKVLAGSGANDTYSNETRAHSAVLNSPTYVASAPNGDVYFTDSANSVLRSFSYGTGIVGRVAGTPGLSGFRSGRALSALLGSPAGLCVPSPYGAPQVVVFAGENAHPFIIPKSLRYIFSFFVFMYD